MLFIVGLLVVLGCIIGGYSVHGNLKVLWQPIEFVIIAGGAFGAMLITNPSSVLKQSLKLLPKIFGGKPYLKADYLELLQCMFEIFKLIKTKGLLQIETHVENPNESDLFKKYPKILKDHHVVDFICDNLRIMTIGMDNPYILSDALDQEIEVHHHDVEEGAKAITTFGDSLPALGIVAAVLGVIVTMGSIKEPPEILGGLIGAALVGTFAGIMLSYGIFSPIGAFLEKYAHAQTGFLVCIKVGLISQLQGNAPAISVEFMRKSIPYYAKPSFKELDQLLNESKG